MYVGRDEQDVVSVAVPANAPKPSSGDAMNVEGEGEGKAEYEEATHVIPRHPNHPPLTKVLEFTEKHLGTRLKDGEEPLPEDTGIASAGGGGGDRLLEFNAAALEQLQMMGFPLVRRQKALLATVNSDAEVAMGWLFEHMEDAGQFYFSSMFLL
ncbi:hypothetical protein D9611_012873 [Ephemerocybe angulata]|uniref:ubiquitinyl hydrolase 1 n=1 Tax=Ephemerocybe angulata TaxID=980116 RepID=A0A8H5BAK3_9AGAR|nr:hypothetical protein D9611_012873 [Tulosesus angulatus]